MLCNRTPWSAEWEREIFLFSTQEEKQDTEHLDRKAHRQRMETIRYEKTLRSLQKINREGKSFFRPQDFFIWPIWSDAFLGGGGNGEKWVRIVRFCIEKEKTGVKAMIFIDRIAPREGYQAEWQRGVKKWKWSLIAPKRTFADEKYSSRVMREGTKKILLRQESLQK